MTLYPNLLKKGAVFGVWTPSSPAPFLFPIRYQRAISAIQKRGYSVIEGASCAKKHEFSPNFDRELAKDFHCLLTNPKVDAILFSTGGHSTISVLPHINWELIKQYPKPVIGYSDATVFLLAYYKMTQIISFHGQWLSQNGVNMAAPGSILLNILSRSYFQENVSDFTLQIIGRTNNLGGMKKIPKDVYLREKENGDS